MTKAPQAFRTISEVSETLDVPQHVLRFWESKFPQIKPLKRAGGRRYYRPEDIDLLRGVRALLYGEGYTIKGVQKLLRDSGSRYVGEVGRYGLQRAGRPASETIDRPNGLTDSDEPPSQTLDDVEPSVRESNDDAPTGLSDHQELEDRRTKLEAALTELLALRDVLRAARPRKKDAA